MSSESIIRDDDGRPTHIRVTSDDGSESRLYEYDSSAAANVFNDHKGKTVEVSQHHEDGTTDAYEFDGSAAANVFNDNRGKKKN